MRRTGPFARRLGALLALALPLAGPAALAQSPFSPAIQVNEDAITYYELEQRALFLRLLRAPGDVEEQAREGLIEDRLKAQAVEQAGIVLTDEQLQAGLEEFAARTNLSAEAFVEALEAEGVAAETLRDFVGVSIAWREYIRGRFGPQAVVSQTDIDRELAVDPTRGGIRVLLSEVILPITPATIDEAGALAEEISQLSGYDAFAAAAAQFSAAETAGNGGRLGWLNLSNLPPPLQPVLLDLVPGEITTPILLPNAIAVFQMRGIEEVVAAAEKIATIDYATFLIPGGRSAEALRQAAALRERVDRCDDLYGEPGADVDGGVLERKTEAPGAIPSDVALELAKLDLNEVSTALTRGNGQYLVFLMLCQRVSEARADATLNDIGDLLSRRMLQSIADNHLAKLRADAYIVER